MFGQWFGNVEGDNEGYVTINIDRDRKNVGSILYVDINNDVLGFIAIVRIDNGENGKLNMFINEIQAYKPGHGIVPDPAQFNNILPSFINLEGYYDDVEKIIYGHWSDNIGKKGEFRVENTEIGKQTEPDRIVESWSEFRKWVIDKMNMENSVIFRGQDDRYLLRSSFHRTGRRDFFRYTNEDLQLFSRELAAYSGNRYPTTNSNEYIELMYIAQHHGFPTPLLDWTKSPFIASYFAFSRLKTSQIKENGYVRIFILNRDIWSRSVYCSHDTIFNLSPTIYPIENIYSPGNIRSSIQQSIVTFTNFREMENIIFYGEKMLELKCLERIDIPWRERNIAMKELEMMGITEASLFPGVDGIALGLKEKLFNL